MFNFKNNKLNWKELIFYLFFFFNTVFITSPLVLTNFLSLIWWKKALSSRFFKSFVIYFSILLLYVIVHIYNGVHLVYYFKSLTFFIIIYFSVIAAILFIERFSGSFSYMFKKLNVFSFWLFLIGCLAIFTPLRLLFWEIHTFTGEKQFLRYQGLVYEASFYAYVIAPIIIFQLLNILIKKSTFKNWILLLMGMTPVLFTYSFGFFAAMILSVLFSLIVIVIYKRSFPRRFFYPFIAFLLLFIAVISFENEVSKRVWKIARGNDTSVNGRTYEAFYLANEMAKDKSLWFGIGPGQVKVVGEQHIRPFYNYPKSDWPIVTLPNITAETLAIFGYFGLLFRIGFQLFIFIKFKVYQNYFQLLLFGFLFFYQLMGSYITSTFEYSFWIIASIPIFKDFNIKKQSFLNA